MGGGRSSPRDAPVSTGSGDDSPEADAVGDGERYISPTEETRERVAGFEREASTEEEDGEGDGGDGAGALGDWREFERGDEKFLEHGDRVAASTGGGEVTGEIAQIGESDLLGVETDDGERVTIESWDIDRYRSREGELDDVRNRLREYFDNMGVGAGGGGALESYTDDTRYREYQDHLRSGSDVAERSPMYDDHPQMETVSAILSTADEETARQLKEIQSWADSSLPEEMTVHRGIDVNTDDFLDRAERARENGDVIVDAGFQSATIDREVTEGFGNVRLDIRTDHGVYVRAASQHAGEDEVLLPAGSQFEVVAVDRETNTVSVEARGGFDFDAVDVAPIRERIREEGMSYPEAIEDVV